MLTTWNLRLSNGSDGHTPAAYTTISSLRGSKVAFWVSVLWLINVCRDTLTFRTWTLFQKAFPQDIDRHSTFRVHDRLEGLLPSVVERLAKLDLGVLTFLCIEAIDMTIDELVALSKIKTLAVLALEIGKNTRNGAISVQTIRDWGRSVGESGAFKSLQVLIIDTYIALPRKLVLKSVSAFPSLKLVGVYSPLPPATADCWEDWRLRSPLPYSEWVSSGSTKALAMQQLYDAPTSANTCRFLSIHYTQGNKIAREDNIAWFVRELKDEPDRSKRTGGHKPPLHSKKRKVRDDKKVDMGLLLGSFT
jgi:hypothetical protein